MEVAAFHPLRTWREARPGRLVSVALFLAFVDRSRDRLVAAGRYPASCSAEPGLSSPRTGSRRRAVTVWLASDANGSTARRCFSRFDSLAARATRRGAPREAWGSTGNCESTLGGRQRNTTLHTMAKEADDAVRPRRGRETNANRRGGRRRMRPTRGALIRAIREEAEVRIHSGAAGQRRSRASCAQQVQDTYNSLPGGGRPPLHLAFHAHCSPLFPMQRIIDKQNRTC